MTEKPFSQSCENNKKPIINELKVCFKQCLSVLEIGSGTGQHAVYFAKHLPWLSWQSSDRLENHPGILAWIESEPSENLFVPFELDVTNRKHWPDRKFDAVFTANTAHIMSWPEVKQLFSGVGRLLNKDGLFVQYGPFNRNGEFTAPGNREFEKWLKSQGEHMGIRDLGELSVLANLNGLKFVEEIAMPANNMMLVWKRLELTNLS